MYLNVFMIKRLVSALLIVTFLAGCGIACIDKETGLSKASETLAESKGNHVFKFKMQANKSIFRLQNDQTFEIKNVWVENCWSYECIHNEPVVVTDSALQLVIEAAYKGDVYTSDYWLLKTNPVQNESLGNHLGSRLDFIYKGQDTFYLKLVKQKDFKNAEIIDTLRFIKQT
jgi:hypothetical protein